ncbi:MAG: hypothetical protein PHN59_06420, partial [Candidatus Omnitrophica bacterium]|nr:hypothetical protein [Candidatus Omnitrophota bacterium]
MSIKSKLTYMFLAIALIPILFVSAIIFNNYKNYIKVNNTLYLQNVAAFKSEKIETYFNNLKTDVQIVQMAYVIKKGLPVLIQFADS